MSTASDAVAFVEGSLKEFLTVGRRPTGPRIRERVPRQPFLRTGDVVKLTGVSKRQIVERVDGNKIYLKGGAILMVSA